jgi:hypothetical protein
MITTMMALYLKDKYVFSIAPSIIKKHSLLDMNCIYYYCHRTFVSNTKMFAINTFYNTKKSYLILIN